MKKEKAHRKQSPRPFKVPYVARILLAVGTDLIELARFKKPMAPSAWHALTADREDRCILEEPMLDRQTITARPGSSVYQTCQRESRSTGCKQRAWA
jgi:hypothetical protein